MKNFSDKSCRENQNTHFMFSKARYIWTDYKTDAQIAKELKITPILDK
jgi:hypothetical protein